MSASGRDGTDEDESTDDRRDPSDRLERLVSGVSVAFTLVLLSYVLWQGATAPAGAAPTASVESVESPPYDDGGPATLRVTVRIENRGGTGLESVVVGLDCGDAERTIRFAHVPGNGHRTATATCPIDTTPTAIVESWTDG
ncbi:hypothetical protein [Salinigranum sp. GCM10025319]|uniref:hypothetical protein n=1 Tax=Salinigranum sp. GCM10025319 TaxID=3252687 RepID=UPI0036185B4F